MDYGEQFVLTLFTNDPVVASRADRAGVNRIGVDLESIGKQDRQDPRKAWLSNHRADQLPGVRESLQDALLFARTNPFGLHTRGEVESLLDLGVRVLMLPYFSRPAELEAFVDLVAGRALVSALVETRSAAERIEQLVRIPGVDEIHVGLNDLHLQLGLSNHFHVLALPLFERVARSVREAGIPFGFGGVARVSDALLPVPSTMVLAQFPYFGADRALVSRAFLGAAPDEIDFEREIRRVRRTLSDWAGRSADELQVQHQAFLDRVKEVRLSEISSE